MKRRALTLVILVIFTGIIFTTSIAGYTYHKIRVVDEWDDPLEDVWLRIWIQIGPDPDNEEHWTSVQGQTDAFGVFYNSTIESDDEALSWEAELFDPVWVPIPEQRVIQVNYPLDNHTFLAEPAR